MQENQPPTTMPDGHSEEYFKDYRDFWWNHDFLKLLRTIQDWETSTSGPHDWAQQGRYLKALGQESEGLCEGMRKHSEAEMIRFVDAVKTGCYFTAGGTLMYLVSGRKDNKIAHPTALRAGR